MPFVKGNNHAQKVAHDVPPEFRLYFRRLGAAIRLYRQSKGLRLGTYSISFATATAIETGTQRSIRFATYLAMAKDLGIAPSQLLKMSEDMVIPGYE